MSLKTWKAEFYPTPAYRCRKKDAVAHSLRKWIGLRPAKLKKHNLRLNCQNDVIDNDGRLLGINADSCSLCCVFLRLGCSACPLYKVLGHGCLYYDNEAAPYNIWKDIADPNPMIRALRKALERQEAKGKPK